MQNRQSLQTRFGRITFDGDGDMLQRFADASLGAVALTRLVEQEVLIAKLREHLKVPIADIDVLVGQLNMIAGSRQSDLNDDGHIIAHGVEQIERLRAAAQLIDEFA